MGTCEENTAIHDTRQEDGLAKTRNYTLLCANRKMTDNVELIYVGLTIVVGGYTRQGQSDVREGVNK